MSPAPDFSIEQKLLAARIAGDGGEESLTIIGVDEAGRGPWAGPVVAGAAWIEPGAVALLPQGIDDSKKLTAKKRGALWAALQDMARENPARLKIATGMVAAEEIDTQGILPATFTAMQSAAIGLGLPPTARLHILVDGTLTPPFPALAQKAIQTTAVKKGDCQSLSIAIAAIAAKETRDALMAELHRAHPRYGWGQNKGYGTAAHQAALKAHGPTPYHRLSYRPVAAIASARGYKRNT